MKNPEERMPGTSGKVRSKRRRLPTSLSVRELQAVWRESRDAAGGSGKPGVDRITAEEFKLHIDLNIDRIRREIQLGEYRFQRLRIAPILKANGSYRIVAVPTVQDRFVQRAILAHLHEHERGFSAESEISFGFVKRKTLTNAQEKARDYRVSSDYVYQTDIEKFFDHIPRDMVKEKISGAVRTKAIRGLLLQIVDSELDNKDEDFSRIAKENGIQRGRGLRQGMPVSPLLSNLLLKDFDRALMRAGMSAVRYADDITVFCSSKDACLRAHDLVASELSKFDLRIPSIGTATTNIYGPTDDVEFLGVNLRKAGSRCLLLAPCKKIAAIEEKLKKIGTKEECWDKRRTLQRAARLMDSVTMGYEHALAIADNRKEFSNRLTAARRKAFESLLVSVLGERVVRSLGPVERSILGFEDFPPSRRSVGRGG